MCVFVIVYVERVSSFSKQYGRGIFVRGGMRWWEVSKGSIIVSVMWYLHYSYYYVLDVLAINRGRDKEGGKEGGGSWMGKR